MNKMIKKYITLVSVLLSLLIISGLVIKSADSSAAESKQKSCFKSFEELNGKRVAMLSGAPFADLVSEYVEDAKYSY